MIRVPGDEDDDGEDAWEVDPRPPLRPVRTVLWGILVITVSMIFYCIEIWLS